MIIYLHHNVDVGNSVWRTKKTLSHIITHRLLQNRERTIPNTEVVLYIYCSIFNLSSKNSSRTKPIWLIRAFHFPPDLHILQIFTWVGILMFLVSATTKNNQSCSCLVVLAQFTVLISLRSFAERLSWTFFDRLVSLYDFD